MTTENKLGYWKRGTRAKEGVYETIDNVTKFALSDDDYEEYEEWVDYTEEELARMAEQEEAEIKKAEQEEFLSEAPARLDATELSVEDLLNAIAELGAIVAGE